MRLLVASFLCAGVAVASAAPASSSAVSDTAWPRQFSSSGTTLTVYQPQLDGWDGHSLQAHAAVSVRPPGANEITFGVLWISARTDVDKESRLVQLERIEIPRVSFPSRPESDTEYRDLIRREVPKWARPIALDRLEASLAVLEERRKGAALALRNDPPRILFSRVPAVLVSIDGPPVYRAIPGARLERVLNTRPLILRDDSGSHYLHVFDGWMRATSLEGPWAVAADAPAELERALQQLTRSGQPVDLLEGDVPESAAGITPTAAAAPARPSLATGPAPAVFVATSPTELLVTEGEPNWIAIEDTGLLYVQNTTGNIFKDLSDQETYILISGRWYHSSSESGPWEYVSGRALPAEFAKIPDDSPKENVKASIPSTAQAAEALIADEIPQTAKVDRKSTKMTPPEYDGEPRLAPIRGTSLQYVVNASLPVILAEGTWYAVENGVWFAADSPRGPWIVAGEVPPAIYSIPPDCPIHYVTYVRIYEASPDFVRVGYTPGYTGTCIDDDGLVVYGTGYPYPPWIGAVWYGAPVTWGLGFGLAWTPWWGWSFDLGFGWGWGWRGGGWVWGCLPPPWWGPVGWGWHPGGWHWQERTRTPRVVPWRPGRWAAMSGSIYRRWSGTVTVAPRPAPAATPGRHPVGVYGRAYNSRTGELAAGQRAAVRGVYPQPRGAPPRVSGRPENDVYAGRDGRVYRRDDRGNWKQLAPRDTRPPDRERIRPLERERGARETGEQRSRAARPPAPPPPRAAPPRAAPRPAPARPAAPRGGADRHR